MTLLFFFKPSHGSGSILPTGGDDAFKPKRKKKNELSAAEESIAAQLLLKRREENPEFYKSKTRKLDDSFRKGLDKNLLDPIEEILTDKEDYLLKGDKLEEALKAFKEQEEETLSIEINGDNHLLKIKEEQERLALVAAEIALQKIRTKHINLRKRLLYLAIAIDEGEDG